MITVDSLNFSVPDKYKNMTKVAKNQGPRSTVPLEGIRIFVRNSSLGVPFMAVKIGFFETQKAKLIDSIEIRIDPAGGLLMVLPSKDPEAKKLFRRVKKNARELFLSRTILDRMNIPYDRIRTTPVEFEILPKGGIILNLSIFQNKVEREV